MIGRKRDATNVEQINNNNFIWSSKVLNIQFEKAAKKGTQVFNNKSKKAEPKGNANAQTNERTKTWRVRKEQNHSSNADHYDG